jgi:hypothetical protein
MGLSSPTTFADDAVKIIVTSGHVKVTEESLPAGALFMPKPYDPAEITHKVREMIAA